MSAGKYADGPWSIAEHVVQNDEAATICVVNANGCTVYRVFVNACHGYKAGYDAAMRSAVAFKDALEAGREWP